MRVAAIGRTRILLEAIRRLLQSGHEIGIVWTDRAEPSDNAAADDFSALAKHCGAQFVNRRDIETPESRKLLHLAACDVAISVNWGSLLSETTRALFPHGILNAHAGDLPRYKGNACPNWAIINGELYVGLCIHVMNSALDGGDVLVRRKFPLRPDSYIGEVYAWLEQAAPEAFLEALNGLASNTIKAEPQSTKLEDRLRCYPRRPDDGRINWSSPVETIHRLIRASSRPFPGAYAMLEGTRRVTIWRADPVAGSGPFLAVPGQVCFRLENDAVVACADGLLRLRDIEVEDQSGDAAKMLVHKSLRNRLT